MEGLRRRAVRCADANHDGFVDRTEYATIVSTDRMFQTVEFSYYDTNGDGKLDRAEFVDKPNRAFALLDKDQPCTLNAEPGCRRARSHRADIRLQEGDSQRSARELPDRHEVLGRASN